MLFSLPDACTVFGDEHWTLPSLNERCFFSCVLFPLDGGGQLGVDTLTNAEQIGTPTWNESTQEVEKPGLDATSRSRRLAHVNLALSGGKHNPHLVNIHHVYCKGNTRLLVI